MKIIFFSSFIFGTLVTFFGYFWGVNNHISHIPIVLRILNPNFLPNDFYINNAFYSNQRFYYGQIIAFFSKIIGLKYSFLFLTLMTNFLNIFLISFLTYKIFKSKKSAVLAGFLTTQPLIEIGGATFLTLNYLIPHLIAVTFSVLATYSGFFVNYYLAVIFFILSSLIHPQLGIETAFLSFFTWFLVDFFWRKEALLKVFKKYFFPIIVFFLFSYFFSSSLKLGNDLISDKEAIFINIFIRNPHHHLFYTIDKITWIITLAYLITIFLIIFNLRKEKNIQSFLLFSILIISEILVIVILGFIFTEIYPIKIIAFAQTLRLFYLVKLIGIILISGYFLKIKNQNEFLISLFNPIGTLLYFVFEEFKKNIKKFQQEKSFLNIFYFLGLFFLIFWLIDVNRVYRFSFIFLGIFFILMFFYEAKKYLYIAGFFVFLITLMILFNPPEKFIIKKWLKPYQPKLEIFYSHQEMPYLASFAKKNTDENVIFLTPADFGQFRFIAERALVVDFKTFIFNEKMKDWYQRIIDIYGEPKNFYYYFIIDELNRNFKKINDQKIIFLKKKYNFNYAILYKETKTNFPVIYSFGNYKIIKVDL